MNDPLIDEIRRARRQISDELGPDLVGFVEHYAEIETRFARAVEPRPCASVHRTRRGFLSGGAHEDTDR